GAGVEGEEIGPGLLEAEANASRIRRLHGDHPLLQRLVGRPPVALEGELHVLRGDGVAIVEARVLSQDEFPGEMILGDRPRLGEIRGERLPRHGLHEGIVERVVHQEGRDHPARFRGVEPGRGERDVDAPDDLALRAGVPDASAGSTLAPESTASDCGFRAAVRSSSASGSDLVKSVSYNRTSASTACAADTQWMVPLTLRPLLSPPTVAGSYWQRTSITSPA